MERYLKLFTFLPTNHIHLLMRKQREDPSQRTAQHLLAKEVVELAHGEPSAKRAELAHRDAFGRGTHFYPLSALRKALQHHPLAAKVEKNMEEEVKEEAPIEQPGIRKPAKLDELLKKLTAHKKEYIGASNSQNSTASSNADTTVTDTAAEVVTIPYSLLHKGTFSHLLYAAGLVSSKSDGHRLVKSQGAYVVEPNSGTSENPSGLAWSHVPHPGQESLPLKYLVDQKALVLRSGKSKIKICRVVQDREFEALKLSFPGWDDFKAKQAGAASNTSQLSVDGSSSG